MDTNFDINSQIDNDYLARLKAENNRLSEAYFSLDRRHKEAMATIKDLKDKLSNKEEEARAKESEVIIGLRSRIDQLKAEAEKGYSEAVAQQRTAIEEEVRKDYEGKIKELEIKVKSLTEQLSTMGKEREDLAVQVAKDDIQITNLGAEVVDNQNKRFGQLTEQIQLRAGRHADDLAALATLSFDGNEKSGMTQEQAEKLDAYRSNSKKGFQLLQLSAADAKELSNLIEIKRQHKEEQRRRRMERAAGQKKKRVKFGGLDAASVNRRISELLKSRFPGIDPSCIKIETFSEDRPLPNDVTIIMEDGCPDFTYHYSLERTDEKYTLYIVECVRVKERKNSKKQDTCDNKDASAITHKGQDAPEQVGNEQVEPAAYDIEFSETGFATVPCAPLPVKGALYTTFFTAALMRFILMEKYVHCSTLDSIMRRLALHGVSIPETTFNDQLHHTLDVIRLGMEDLFIEKLRQEKYVNVDETVERVGVMEEEPPPGTAAIKDEEPQQPQDVPYEEVGDPSGNITEATEEAAKPSEESTLKPVLRRHYKHKYLWVFHGKLCKIVYYRYDNGSRGRHVLVDVLTNSFVGSLTSDCFVVYDAVGDKVLPFVLRSCCWVHMRRPCIEALIVLPDEAAVLIDIIRELFSIEATMNITSMTPEEKVLYRAEHSIPKLNDFFNQIDLYQADPALMAYDKMAKVVRYAQNNKTELMNYIKDGNVDMHNNRAERDFKVIKKIMRVSLNIGSERAAMNHAFLHSLIETAKLWKLNLDEYLPAVFEAFDRAPRLALDWKKPEGEQIEKIEKWKAEVRPFIEHVLPWNYGRVDASDVKQS